MDMISSSLRESPERVILTDCGLTESRINTIFHSILGLTSLSAMTKKRSQQFLFSENTLSPILIGVVPRVSVMMDFSMGVSGLDS